MGSQIKATSTFCIRGELSRQRPFHTTHNSILNVLSRQHRAIPHPNTLPWELPLRYEARGIKCLLGLPWSELITHLLGPRVMNVKFHLGYRTENICQKERKFTFSFILTDKHDILYWGSNLRRMEIQVRGKSTMSSFAGCPFAGQQLYKTLARFHLTQDTDRWLCYALEWQNVHNTWNDIVNSLLKTRNWGWRDSFVVEGTGCS